MRDEEKKVPQPPLMSEHMPDKDLEFLLASWVIPEVPPALDERVINSYRRELGVSEEKAMKKCPTCQQVYANQFAFCPADATPLGGVVIGDAAATIERGRRGDYHLTILADESLSQRLTRAAREVGRESRLTWPEFKRDPFGFMWRLAAGYAQLSWTYLSRPNVAVGLTSAVLIVMSLVIGVVALDRLRLNRRADVADAARNDLDFLGMINRIPEEQKKPDPGNAGMNKGNGGGSKTQFERLAGGGGGGRSEAKPASQGKLPQASLDVPQIVAPDVRPPTVKNPSLPVPATIYADPKLFPPDASALPYGDPKSKSIDPSPGSGTGNGIGTGTGGGVGSGEGGGVGPGSGGNAGGGSLRAGGGGAGGDGGNTVFAARDVTTKAIILSKPEPSYSEEARKNNVTGTVVLRAILGASGQVLSVTPVQRLPYGLTEKAILAARQIKFRPATKDGRAVSQYVRIEYNFNMY